MSDVGIIAVLLCVLLMIYLAYTFNKLVSLSNKVKLSFAQVDVLLKRRYDLIPRIVEVTNEYIKHERSTLEAVIAARDSACSALFYIHADPTKKSYSVVDLNVAEKNLINNISNLSLLFERYPDLKSSQIFINLSEELVFTENLIAYSRVSYNDSVMLFNIYKQSFPQALFSSILGYSKHAKPLVF